MKRPATRASRTSDVRMWMCRVLTIASLPLLTACASARYARVPDAGGCIVERIAAEDGTSQFQFNGLSPDGRLLAIGWERQGQHGAYLLDLRSGARTDLPAVIDNAVSFSPDGRMLLSAVRTPDRRTEILELSRANGATRVLASDPAAEFLPSYSRDMSRVYFNSYRTGASDLYVIERATGALTRLTTDERYDAHAQLSPDGARLAFHRQIAPGNYDIVVLDLRTGAEQVLAPAQGEDAYPAWSPDGRFLAFSSDRAAGPGKTDLFVMRADGGEVHPLTRGGNDSYATWAPNGRDVYFVSKREGHGVYRLRLDARRGCGPDLR